jgi:prolipoprotein diacylglyceryltransferase
VEKLAPSQIEEIPMDRNELIKLINKSEKQFERRKFKRFALTVLFYAVVFTAVEYVRSDLYLVELVSTFGICLILTIPFVLLSTVIFEQLIRLSKDENDTLEWLRNRLKDKE